MPWLMLLGNWTSVVNQDRKRNWHLCSIKAKQAEEAIRTFYEWGESD